MAQILVVDHDTIARGSVRELLRDSGHSVDVAEDIDQALDLLRKLSFDVVLADLLLQPSSGLSLIEAIRAEAPDQSVILMTANATAETASAAIREGAADYLAKPVSPDLIIEAVDRITTAGADPTPADSTTDWGEVTFRLGQLVEASEDVFWFGDATDPDN
ncbi:MAG: response regulator, partial [Actinomycetia bacterium]|nr:response regulator [Actinomycetes bacterium]